MVCLLTLLEWPEAFLSKKNRMKYTMRDWFYFLDLYLIFGLMGETGFFLGLYRVVRCELCDAIPLLLAPEYRGQGQMYWSRMWCISLISHSSQQNDSLAPGSGFWKLFKSGKKGNCEETMFRYSPPAWILQLDLRRYRQLQRQYIVPFTTVGLASVISINAARFN